MSLSVYGHVCVNVCARACVNKDFRYLLICVLLIHARIHLHFLSCGTIFMFLCAQVTWHSVEHLIAQLKHNRRSLLK